MGLWNREKQAYVKGWAEEMLSWSEEPGEECSPGKGTR